MPPGRSRGCCWEQRLGDASIDFAHPRRAPDRAAHTRQRVLLAAAVVVFAAVGAAIVGNVKLRQLAEEYEGLREQASDLAPKSHRFTRDVFKLKHLEHWENAGAGWLEHALYLQGVAPPPAELVLDGWSGTLNFTGVDYDKRAPAEKRWSAPWTATIILAGEATGPGHGRSLPRRPGGGPDLHRGHRRIGRRRWPPSPGGLHLPAAQ